MLSATLIPKFLFQRNSFPLNILASKHDLWRIRDVFFPRGFFLFLEFHSFVASRLPQIFFSFFFLSLSRALLPSNLPFYNMRYLSGASKEESASACGQRSDRPVAAEQKAHAEEEKVVPRKKRILVAFLNFSKPFTVNNIFHLIYQHEILINIANYTKYTGKWQEE